MDKRLKILNIITDSNIGGAGRLLCYLCSASDKSKYEYSVLLPSGSRLRPELEKLGIKVTEINGLNSSFSLKVIKALTAAIKAEKPDIVHTHSSLSGQLAAKKAGVHRRVMTKHCSDLPSPFLMHFPLHQLSRLYWNTISCCIATDDSAALAMRAAGMPGEKIKIIYNGCPELKRSIPAEQENLRCQLGIPENRLCIGYFGRLEPEKGPDRLLDAAAMCLRFTEDIHFIICGDGSEAKELRNKAGRSGIENNVTFTGYVQNPSAYMSLCRIIVSPSVAVETSSLSLCEGLSLGLVPVVTDVGGSRKLIGADGVWDADGNFSGSEHFQHLGTVLKRSSCNADGNFSESDASVPPGTVPDYSSCGICVPQDDPPALYRAIMELVRDPDLLELYSRKAQARFKERCTVQRMAEETARVYDAVAENKPVC